MHHYNFLKSGTTTSSHSSHSRSNSLSRKLFAKTSAPSSIPNSHSEELKKTFKKLKEDEKNLTLAKDKYNVELTELLENIRLSESSRRCSVKKAAEGMVQLDKDANIRVCTSMEKVSLSSTLINSRKDDSAFASAVVSRDFFYVELLNNLNQKSLDTKLALLLLHLLRW